MHFMTNNNYIDSATQKAFMEGVPGCTEHQYKLWQAILDARRSQRNITVCWLDLANAFGSIHQNLISYALWHYQVRGMIQILLSLGLFTVPLLRFHHSGSGAEAQGLGASTLALPGHFIRTIQSLYSGLTAVISTKEWESQPVHLARGLFQGDPLSSAIFNVIINLYLDTISSECSHNGYRFSSSHHQMPVLQYADDTCLTANSKANCQAMLRTTGKWLDWSLLKAKVPKCAAISICGQTGKTRNPHLVLSNAKIPYLGNKSMSFLGLPINAVLSTDGIKEQLALKLEKFLTVTDRSPPSLAAIRRHRFQDTASSCSPGTLPVVSLPSVNTHRTSGPTSGSNP